jgi:hypothetical protein
MYSARRRRDVLEHGIKPCPSNGFGDAGRRQDVKLSLRIGCRRFSRARWRIRAATNIAPRP